MHSAEDQKIYHFHNTQYFKKQISSFHPEETRKNCNDKITNKIAIAQFMQICRRGQQPGKYLPIVAPIGIDKDKAIPKITLCHNILQWQ